MPWPKKTYPHTEAKFDGPCPGCGEDIDEGDEIFLIDGEWVCVPCKDQDE